MIYSPRDDIKILSRQSAAIYLVGHYKREEKPMDVYYRAPRFHPHTKELLFPNPRDIPEDRWVSFLTINARSVQDVDRYKLLQADLFEVMNKSAEYLEGLPVDGSSIFFYRHQYIGKKGEARRTNLSPHLYLFGVVISTDHGESYLSIQIETEKTLVCWFGSHGIADKLFDAVIMPYDWRSRMGIHKVSQTKFDVIVRAAFEEYENGYSIRHYNGYPFDVPYEFYRQIVQRSL